MDKLRGLIKEKGRDNVDYYKFISEEIIYDEDKLILLTKAGSNLYNLDTEDSDLDIKGLFFPSKKSLLIGDRRDNYGQYTTSKEDNKKNNKDDVDIEIWSVHRLFKHLLKGDTNAYDLLFSLKNEDVVIYSDYFMNKIFSKRKKLIGSKSIIKGFIGYAYGQVKRYEAKGFNFQTLRYIMRYFKNHYYKDNDRLGKYVETLIQNLNLELLEQYNDEEKRKNQVDRQLKIVEEENEKFLSINEYKKYPFGIRVKQFLDAIQGWMGKYGSRVKNNDKGIDYISISHAFRVLYLAEELAKKGDMNVKFFGEKRKLLLKIKRGGVDWKKYIDILDKEVDRVGDLIRNSNKLRSKPKKEVMDNLLLKYYR